MKIACIGLGNMGSGIASCIQKAGFDLVVWNRSPAKLQPFVQKGARAAASPRDAATDADVIVTSLMDDHSIKEILTGEHGFLKAMKSGATHVCVTTISPDFAEELEHIHRDHGSRFVFCPVLGRPDAAAEGKLIGLAAGEAGVVDLVAPVLESFTVMLNRAEPTPRRAAMLKLCINYALISTVELMGEVCACAEKAGMNLENIAQTFPLLFHSPVLPMYLDKTTRRDFDDGGFRMTGGLKDVQLMLSAAQSVGAHFDIGKIIEEKMNVAIAQGLQNKDWSAIYEVTRKRAGL